MGAQTYSFANCLFFFYEALSANKTIAKLWDVRLMGNIDLVVAAGAKVVYPRGPCQDCLFGQPRKAEGIGIRRGWNGWMAWCHLHPAKLLKSRHQQEPKPLARVFFA